MLGPDPASAHCPHTLAILQRRLLFLYKTVLCSEDINMEAWQHWESILRDDGLVNYREDYGILVLNI